MSNQLGSGGGWWCGGVVGWWRAAGWCGGVRGRGNILTSGVWYSSMCMCSGVYGKVVGAAWQAGEKVQACAVRGVCVRCVVQWQYACVRCAVVCKNELKTIHL